MGSDSRKMCVRTFLVQIPMLTEINSSQLKNFTGGMDLIVLEYTGFDNLVS